MTSSLDWKSLCVAVVAVLAAAACQQSNNHLDKKEYAVGLTSCPNDDSCAWSNDGTCDDGGYGSEFSFCGHGTDVSDCGLRTCGGSSCNSDACAYANDGTCDDGGPGSDFNLCDLGTDMSDCPVRSCGDDPCNNDTCAYANDGTCDDGGAGSDFALCAIGTDASDCPVRSCDGGGGDMCANDNSCEYERDGECDDGGLGADTSLCDLGTDVDDCGLRVCHGEDQCDNDNSCLWAYDGACDDGGSGSQYNVCDFGTDTADCGARVCDAMSGCVNDNSCAWARDGQCDTDGFLPLCAEGTDLDDCGFRVCQSDASCSDDDSCVWSNDGECDDGGPGATSSLCAQGTDVSDCGYRTCVPAANPLPFVVLPASRSAQPLDGSSWQDPSLWSAVTVNVVVVNASGRPVTSLGIMPVTDVGASFQFIQVNAEGIALGAPNQRVAHVEAGAVVYFHVTMTPNSSFAPTNVEFRTFADGYVSSASHLIGVDTLLLAAETSTGPDIVTLLTTAEAGGVVRLAGGSGYYAGSFSVLTVNAGFAGAITARVGASRDSLPLSVTLCRTNSVGVCESTPSSTLAVPSFGAGNHTFGVFIDANGAVPLDLEGNRLFLYFQSPNGFLRGASSVAVTTDRP